MPVGCWQCLALHVRSSCSHVFLACFLLPVHNTFHRFLLSLSTSNLWLPLLVVIAVSIYTCSIPLPNKMLSHTRLTALFPGVAGWASTRKVKTNLDFTEARDSELQWYQLGHMQICTSLQTDNHASTPPLSFLQAGCPSCHPTNSVKALGSGHTLV